MKKTIDVWVPKKIDDRHEFYCGIYLDKRRLPDKKHWQKAKLIIDIPRKKMLSEDDVRDACKECGYGHAGLLEKLFGGEE